MSEKQRIISKKCAKCYWCMYVGLGEETRAKPYKCLCPKETGFVYFQFAKEEEVKGCEHYLYWEENKEALKKSAPHDPRITKEGEH